MELTPIELLSGNGIGGWKGDGHTKGRNIYVCAGGGEGRNLLTRFARSFGSAYAVLGACGGGAGIASVGGRGMVKQKGGTFMRAQGG